MDPLDSLNDFTHFTREEISQAVSSIGTLMEECVEVFGDEIMPPGDTVFYVNLETGVCIPLSKSAARKLLQHAQFLPLDRDNWVIVKRSMEDLRCWVTTAGLLVQARPIHHEGSA